MIEKKMQQILKAQHLQQKTTTYPPNVQLMMALTTLNIFNIYKNSKHPPISLHWHTPKLTASPPPHSSKIVRSFEWNLEGTRPPPYNWEGFCLHLSTGPA